MRIGVIGLGRIGSLHARNLRTFPDVSTLIVADVDEHRVQAVAQELAVESAASLDELLAAGVDGVVIATATDTHPELLKRCIAAGVPTFCEKPVAKELADAIELCHEVRENRATVQIGYPRRFDPGFVAARQAVSNGELGWIHTIRSTTLDPAPPPASYVAVSGGIFRDCAVHDFDIVRWMTGRDVVEVYATGGNKGDAIFRKFDDVDTASALLRFDDDTIGVISNSRYNGRGYDVRLEIHGSRDSIAVGLDSHLPLRSVEPGVTFPDGVPYTFFMDRLAAAFRAEMQAFLDVVAGRQNSPCPIDDAIEASWVAEACTLSLAEHRPVQLAELKEKWGVPSR
ncbi:Inositol 2-dehydrogenase [Acidothermus cellulolyticus 11B]|uniref:Inositol 2-dehydrogenase n=1 Tax=Acidothermus cellulolyticus (strain ATCC 43068 / DSM 8971 / 11B) TaxID=351607 RepID=A0LVX6_ACIC1|nr:Gfo/Idh/MocA family oxidoreductase [Acidothermus cellulolyticus]ABK53586.1 Inositol 2-dehydrogenase [Acidothermus cellulolyticus 11B]